MRHDATASKHNKKQKAQKCEARGYGTGKAGKHKQEHLHGANAKSPFSLLRFSPHQLKFDGVDVFSPSSVVCATPFGKDSGAAQEVLPWRCAFLRFCVRSTGALVGQLAVLIDFLGHCCCEGAVAAPASALDALQFFVAGVLATLLAVPVC